MDNRPPHGWRSLARELREGLRPLFQGSSFPVWIAVIGGLVIRAVLRKVQFLRQAEAAIPPWVSTAAVWLILISLGVLVVARPAKFLVRKSRRVVGPGQKVPRFFGVSYFDRRRNLFVCDLIPMNIIIGELMSVRLRLKKGLGVTVDTGSLSKPAD